MTTKLSVTVKIIFLLLRFSNELHFISAKSGWLYKTDVEAKICYNPNNNLGFCVPTKECAALNFVLQHHLEASFKFFWASQCERMPEASEELPYVCCTNDIQFRKQKTENIRKVDRIVFPDELQKFKEVTEITSESTTVPAVPKVHNFPKPPKCGSVVVENKIYGGQNAALSEFSWMVILEYRNHTTGKLLIDCAGSLINNRYVLTAAHCVQGDILRSNGKLESVRIGEHNTETQTDCDEIECRQPFQRIFIESIIPHANFSLKSYLGTRNQHDIALLRLREVAKFHNFIQPICLPNDVHLEDLKEPTTFVVAGWGHNGTSVRTAIKQKLEVPLVNHEKCRKHYGKKFYLANEQICAGGRFREDSCSGDSGGPLMRLKRDFWVLEGIVSFGLKCGLEQPGIYTNVRHYIDWINENIKN